MRKVVRRPSAAMVEAAGDAATSAVKRALFAKRAKTASNALKVDGLSASKTPRAGQLLALDGAGKFPANVTAVKVATLSTG